VFANQPEEYGVVSQLYAFVAFLMVILTFGMETTLFRFVQDSPDREKVFRTSFLTVIGLNLLFFIGIFFFNGQIANALLFNEHPEYIVLMGVIVIIDAVSSIPLAKLRLEERAMRFALIQFTSIGVNILLNLVLLLGFVNPENPENGVLFILIANLISSLVKPLLLRADFIGFRLQVDWELMKRMLVYAIPIVIAGFAGIINEVIDRIMLKQMLYDPASGFTASMADAQIGIYSACYKLAMLVTILLQAYRYAAEPFFFNQLQNQDRNKLYVKLMNYFVAVVCLVFLVVSLNLDVFKFFIASESYWEGLKVVPILLLANVFLGIYINQSIWYKLSNQTKYGAYISLLGAALTLLINYLFIPIYGYVASAWATMLVYAFQMLVSYFWGQKHYPIPYNLRKFALYLGLSVGIFLLSANLFDATFSWLKFGINNLMIVFYLFIVSAVEGIKLKKINL
jgi:O-antigen/teichoic acid export membrane protein